MRGRGRQAGIAAAFVIIVALVAAALGAGPDAGERPAEHTAAISTVVVAAADADTSASAPGRRSGHRRVLRIGARPQERAYLRFRLPRSPAHERVVLRLFPLSSGSALTVRALRTASWSESTLSHRTAPRRFTTALARSRAPVAGRPVSVDVTRLAARRRVVNLVVESGGDRRVLVASREDRARAPRLIIRSVGGGSAPRAPTRLAATASGSTALELSWSPPAGGPAPARYRLSLAGAIVGATRATTYTYTDLSCATEYLLRVESIDHNGVASPPSLLRASTGPCAPPVAQAPIVVAAAGDIACDPSSGGFGGGDPTRCQQRATARLVTDMRADAVLMLGDAQYETATAAKFATSYDPSWGAFKSITWATAGGSHDLDGGGAFYDYFGARAGPRPHAPFSAELGDWHLVVLNANCDNSAVGGCAAGSPQVTWLEADLAAHPAACTIAIWHQARFSSGPRHGTDSRTDTFTRRLHAAGAEIILNAHDHMYERFAPQTPDGDRDDARGIAHFVVGTGGKSLEDSLGTIERNSEIRQIDTFGVLKLTLRPGAYDWEFVPVPGGSFTDAGTRRCH